VRNAKEGIEVLDRAGAVIAAYGRGFAYDAQFPKGAVPTPVTVRLLSQKANVAIIEVAIADPDWLTTPGRAFPVTIDPTWTQSTYPGQGGLATMVIDGTPGDPLRPTPRTTAASPSAPGSTTPATGPAR
jgi:hypothetical protein